MTRNPKNNLAQIESGQFLTIDKKVIYYAVILLLVYWLTSLYQAVISSLVLGILLAYLLHPIVAVLTHKLQIKSRISAGIVFISFVFIILAGARIATPILLNQIKILANDFQAISDELIELQPVMDKVFNINIPLADLVPAIENEINQLLVPARLFRMLRSATDNLVWIMVTLMTCFYLLSDHSKLINWIYKIFPDSMGDDLRQLLKEINLVWKTYLRG